MVGTWKCNNNRKNSSLLNFVYREMEKYLSLSMEEAANSPIPLLFASFPSAKDSTWEERYPGSREVHYVVIIKLIH